MLADRVKRYPSDIFSAAVEFHTPLHRSSSPSTRAATPLLIIGRAETGHPALQLLLEFFALELHANDGLVELLGVVLIQFFDLLQFAESFGIVGQHLGETVNGLHECRECWTAPLAGGLCPDGLRLLFDRLDLPALLLGLLQKPPLVLLLEPDHGVEVPDLQVLPFRDTDLVAHLVDRDCAEEVRSTQVAVSALGQFPERRVLLAPISPSREFTAVEIIDDDLADIERHLEQGCSRHFVDVSNDLIDDLIIDRSGQNVIRAGQRCLFFLVGHFVPLHKGTLFIKHESRVSASEFLTPDSSGWCFRPETPHEEPTRMDAASTSHTPGDGDIHALQSQKHAVEPTPTMAVATACTALRAGGNYSASSPTTVIDSISRLFCQGKAPVEVVARMTTLSDMMPVISTRSFNCRALTDSVTSGLDSCTAPMTDV